MQCNITELSFKSLVNELIEGRELTRELQLNLINEPHFSSNEVYIFNAKNILAKLEKSLQILQYDPINQIQKFQYVETSNFPNSFSGNSRSQDSAGNFKDVIDRKDCSRKRRISPRETMRVQACTNSGLEGPIEDGYNWRKYGQKDILGAKFPRAYYRCTYRFAQNCVATKQVQRNDDDPSFFEVSYRGKHTCSQASAPSSSTPKLEPIETATHSSYYPQKIMWDFKIESLKDIEPKLSSFCYSSISNPFINNSQNTPTLLNYSDNFVGHGNFATNTSSLTYQSTPSFTNNNVFNEQNEQDDTLIDLQSGGSMQEVSQPSSTSASNSPPIGSELSFVHQSECWDDFIFENLHFLQ